MTTPNQITGEDFSWLLDEILISLRSVKLKLELESDAEAVAVLSSGLGNMIGVVTRQAGLTRKKADELMAEIITNVTQNYDAEWNS
ncbi:hypothetical protein ACFL54_06620 [Planctomycetota bacterium]